MQLSEAGQYDRGIEELLRAYAILPHPNVLYNIARVCALAGRIDEARDYFGQYLESDPPDRDEVVLILQELEAAQGIAAGPPVSPPSAGTSTGESTATPLAEAARIASLRESAAALRRSAETLRSEVLAEQAATLEAAADALERAYARGSVAPSETASGPAGEAGPGGGTPEVAADAAAPEGADAPSGAGGGPEEAAAGMAVGEAPPNDATYAEAVVSASRSRLSPLDAPASVEIITRQDIRMSGVTHLAELIRRAAGVQVAATTPFDANVAVRGMNRLFNPRVLMLVNGRSTYFDIIGFTYFGQQPFAVEDIERIEVIRGPASVVHGANGFSGVINVVLREPGVEPGAEGHVGVGNGGQFRVTTSVSARTGRVSYRASTGYLQNDQYALPYDPRRVDIARRPADFGLASQMAHALLQLRWRASDHVRLSLESGVTYGGRATYVAAGGIADGYMNSGHHYHGMATLEHRYGHVRAYWNRFTGDPTPFKNGYTPFDMQLDIAHVESDFHHAFDLLGMRHDVHVGGAYRMKHVVADLFLGRATEHHGAAYFEDNVEVADGVRAVLGLRMDYHPLLAHPVFSPRGGVIVRASENRSVRLTATTAFRTPTMVDTYANFAVPTGIQAVDGWTLGTQPSAQSRLPSTAEPERIVTVEAGFVDQTFDALNIEVNAYFSQIRDLIEISNSPHRYTLADYAAGGNAGFDPADDAFIAGLGTFNASPTKYRSYGGEAMLRSNPLDGLDLSLGYGLNLTYVVGAPASVARDLRAPTHSLHGGVQYRTERGIDLSLDVFYSGPTRWPELLGAADGVQRVNLPLAAYAFANARLAYRVLDDRLEFAVAGTNLALHTFRQHPLGQPIAPRVMATGSVRF